MWPIEDPLNRSQSSTEGAGSVDALNRSQSTTQGADAIPQSFESATSRSFAVIEPSPRADAISQSFVVLDDGESAVCKSFAHGAQQKRRHAGWLVGSFIFVTLIVNVGCGYWVTLQHSLLDMANGTCHSASGGDVTPSLEAGLDLVMQWFPEEATLIHQHKNDIIHYIDIIEDPPQNSTLQKLKLVPGRMRTGAPKHETSVLARRLLHLPGLTCMWAVTNFLANVALTLWIVVPSWIWEAADFRKALHGFMEETYWLDARQVKRIERQMHNFADATSAQEKAEVVVQLLKTTLQRGGGWFKFMMHWLAEKGRHPWTTIRSIVTLTATMVGFSRERPNVPLALKIVSADTLLKCAREARRVCRALPSADGSAA